VTPGTRQRIRKVAHCPTYGAQVPQHFSMLFWAAGTCAPPQLAAVMPHRVQPAIAFAPFGEVAAGVAAVAAQSRSET